MPFILFRTCYGLLLPWIRQSIDDRYQYKQLEYVEPSHLGTVKATAFYEAREILSPGVKARSLLVITVRGSASKIDHMVNMNSRATVVGDFIVSDSLLAIIQSELLALLIHELYSRSRARERPAKKNSPFRLIQDSSLELKL